MNYNFPVGGRDALIDSDGSVITHPTGVTTNIKLKVLTANEVDPVREKLVTDLKKSYDGDLSKVDFETLTSNPETNQIVNEAIATIRDMIFSDADADDQLAFDQLATPNQREEILVKTAAVLHLESIAKALAEGGDSGN